MNLFNPLNGKEAKTLILNEITKVLEADSEFREHLTFPRVEWNWRLEMKIYPRTPPEKVVESKGDVIQVVRDEDGNLVPVVAESESHVKEVINSVPRVVDAPDRTRTEEGLVQPMASPGGVRFARRAEVGKAADNPIYSPGLNK